MDEFVEDFTKDVRPYVEANYRVKTDRASRAIAGLSMGGAQTLNIAFGHLDDYGFIGVFSSGIFGINGGFGGAAPSTEWEDNHKTTLDDSVLKKGLELVWFGCGKQDFLVKTSEATVEMLKKHGFNLVSRESEGGHTWINWREYLNEFAPMLFTRSDHAHLVASEPASGCGSQSPPARRRATGRNRRRIEAEKYGRSDETLTAAPSGQPPVSSIASFGLPKYITTTSQVVVHPQPHRMPIAASSTNHFESNRSPAPAAS